MLRYEIEIGEFDGQGYLDKLQKNIAAFRDITARVFIRATFTRIPVWSGASRASLLPLKELVDNAKAVGAIKNLRSIKGLEGQIKPKAFAPKDFTSKDKNHGIDKGIKKGSRSYTKEKGLTAGFTFITSVFQYLLLEEEWDTTFYGNSAVDIFVGANAQEMFPPWADYIKKKKVVFE